MEAATTAGAGDLTRVKGGYPEGPTHGIAACNGPGCTGLFKFPANSNTNKLECGKA
jgi:hypothetical protein